MLIGLVVELKAIALVVGFVNRVLKAAEYLIGGAENVLIIRGGQRKPIDCDTRTER